MTERRPGTRGTVLAIHGGLDRGASFRRLGRRLRTLDLVTYDRRGYQGSRSLPDADLEHHTQDVLALARANSDRPVYVLGHSYGGVVALRAAVLEPKLFTAVVVYEPPLPFIYRRAGWSNAPILEHPGDEAQSFFCRMVSEAAWQRLSDEERQGRRADGPALVNDLQTIRGGPTVDIAELRVPTVYAYGDQGHPDYYAEVARRLEAMNPVISSRLFHHASHGAHLTSPDQFADLLEHL
jgi:pimeloyl-ACP methyl ester carboxylesterase